MTTALTALGYILAGVIGYIVRHYQTPAHHKIVDAAMKEQQEAAAKAMVAGLFNSPAPAAEATKK